MTTASNAGPLLQAVLNLTHYHRAHEEFYASSPRELAVRLQRHARTLQALADQWAAAEPTASSPLSPFEGAPDLNSEAAIQLDGVLFLEGEGEPAEISSLIRDLRSVSADFDATSKWLSTAMQASWEMAAALVDIDELAGVMGERHRIIANDWLAASMNSVIARLLERSASVLERIDFTPAALRADLAGSRTSSDRLYSAAELIDRAADLCSDSAGLVHDNERRWRVFRRAVKALVDAAEPQAPEASAKWG